MDCKAVVGLGNPGSRYAGSRHNVGFDVLDRLYPRLEARSAAPGEPFRPHPGFQAELARVGGLRLVKPATFMNLSGEAVRKVSQFFRLPPESLLVVHDDLDLPLGQLRFRARGSAGGHNGVASIIQHLGTDAFPRLKLGIGRGRSPGAAAGEGVVGHVLGRFAPDEREEAQSLLERAVEAVLFCLDQGLEEAMTRFNRKSP